MRKYLVLGILMLFASVSKAATFQDAQKVFNNLIHKNGFHFYPHLELKYSGEVNAKCTFFTIAINTGMLEFIRNNDELALVLGHELAHFRLMHLYSSPANEYAADALGAYMAFNGGYNACKGANVMYRFHDKGGDTHPNSTERYKRIRSQECRAN